MKHYLFFGFLCLLFISPAVLAQKTVIHIERAKRANYDARLGKDVQRLVGDVILRQDSTLFYCDSAYLNEKTRNFDAFGSVHINVNDSMDIYSDRLIYNGDTRIAELFDNVKLIDDSTVLETQYLLYNRITKLAHYPNNGRITQGEKVLTSVKGYYQSDIKEFYFRKEVVLLTPDYETYSDTLVYNSKSQIAWFYGPTVIRSDENTLYGAYGWYNTLTDQAYLTKRPSIYTMEQMVYADTMFYDRNTGFGRAGGHVEVVDTNYQVIVKGAFGQLWEHEGKSYVTDSAMAVSYDSGDSLYMHADTLFLYFDKEREAKKMEAYYGVRFFRTDLQGVCDSLSYLMSDSTIRMYRDPVLWSDQNQLTADSIHIMMTNKALDSLVMYNNAFIVSRDSIKGFNQIKGKDMIGYFEENELDRIAVEGNAQTVYWVREEDKNLIGINLAKASRMLIKLLESQINEIIYRSSPNEVMYPEKDLPPSEEKLKGFKWLDALRPTDKMDIYRDVHKE
ncbi:MAG: OstA-like protein [Bacteroidales bacterium]|nr:OstA-like protein [Bacteroidales bacterium]